MVSVHVVSVFMLLVIKISETSRPFAIKNLKHHWGVGDDAKGFGANRIRTLVPMATDSPHRVIMV